MFCNILQTVQLTVLVLKNIYLLNASRVDSLELAF